MNIYWWKNQRKENQLPTTFQLNVWSLPQDVQKVVWHNGLNVHIESSGMFSVSSKRFLGVLKVVKNNIYFSNMISLLTFIKV